MADSVTNRKICCSIRRFFRHKIRMDFTEQAACLFAFFFKTFTKRRTHPAVGNCTLAMASANDGAAFIIIGIAIAIITRLPITASPTLMGTAKITVRIAALSVTPAFISVRIAITRTYQRWPVILTHQLFRDFFQKPGGNGIIRAPVDSAGLRAGQVQNLLGAGDAHITQPPFLFHLFIVHEAAGMGEQSFFHPGQKHHRELQAFGRMKRHQGKFVII